MAGHTGATNQVKLSTPPKMTTFGYVKKRGELKKFGVPSKDVQNTFLFGEVKSGKSTTLEVLIRQDIKSDTGFFFLDPHKQAAINVIAAIPPEKRKKIVYISLDSPDVFGRCIQLNPFEYEEPAERFFIVDSFLSMLSHHYSSGGKIGWGPRLEMILRHSLHLLVSKPGAKLEDLGQILINDEIRNEFIAMCPYRPSLDFFEQQYDGIPDEGKTAAFNKIDQLLSTPAIAMLFDTARSTISIPDMISQGLFVIMDLHSKVTADIANLVGSMVIHMFNVEGKRRQSKGVEVNTPFNLYIDECHSFSPSVLRELLNTIRKFGMKLTLATQTADHLDKDFAGEIPSLVQVMISFRCTADTEHLLTRSFPLEPRDITGMSSHYFRLWAKSTPEVRGLATTKPLPVRSFSEVRPIIEAVLKRNGTKIDLNRYKPPLKTKGSRTEVSPLEWFMLNFLYQHGGDVSREDVVSAVQKRFEIVEDKVVNRFRDLQHRGFIGEFLPQPDGINYNPDPLYKYGPATRDRFFAVGTRGRRAGGNVHTDALEVIFDRMCDYFHMTDVDTGTDKGQKADLLVRSMKLAPGQREETIKDKRYAKLDPISWGETYAVEIETEPGKHPDRKTRNLDGTLRPNIKTMISQVYLNYEKNKKLGYTVCFVVFTKKAKEQVIKIMEGHGVGILNDQGIGDYSVNVIPLHATPETVRLKPLSASTVPQDDPNIRAEIITSQAAVLNPHEILGSIGSIKPPPRGDVPLPQREDEPPSATRIDDDEFLAWHTLEHAIGNRGDGVLQSKALDLLMTRAKFTREKSRALIESLKTKGKIKTSGAGSAYSSTVLMVEKFVAPRKNMKAHDAIFVRPEGSNPLEWNAPPAETKKDYDAESESGDTPDPALTTKLEAMQEEADTASKSSAIDSEHPTQLESKPEAQPDPAPQPEAQPDPAPQPEAQPDPAPQPEAQPDPAPQPEAQPDPAPQPEAQPDPAPQPEAQPDPAPQPEAQPDPAPQPEAQPDPAPQPEAQPDPAPQPEPAATKKDYDAESESGDTYDPALATKLESVRDEANTAPKPPAPDSELTPQPEPVDPELAPKPEPVPEPETAPVTFATTTDIEESPATSIPKPKKEKPLPPAYPSMELGELAALVSKSKKLDENLKKELESRGYKVRTLKDGKHYLSHT